MSEEQLRTIYTFAKQNSRSLEKLLRDVEEGIEDEKDTNFNYAIWDAKNVLNVLTQRTASKLGI